MPRLRRNEWNFAHNAATLITETLNAPQYATSPLGHAEPELTEYRGARRLDLVIFRRDNPLEPLITVETKVPWAADGKNPYSASLVEAAHGKASRVGALYFITWNVRRAVIWRTDYPGVALLRRVVFDKEIIDQNLSSASDLDSLEVQESLRNGVEEIVSFLHSLLTGPPATNFLPLDKLFIANIEAALDFPIEITARAIKERMDASLAVKRSVERWMRDVQGWIVSRSSERENLERAARFTCYVLVNRLCFYNALRRKYEQLQRLTVPNNINSGERLQQRLRRAFDEAKRYTGNYETVFDGDYGDNLPFFADEATHAWRELIRSLDRYDFAHIGLDVIGAMYEQLIKPEERHRFGQHYTQPTVVDLINSFAIVDGTEEVLDPSCGGGTFLVRSYARKAYLDPTQDHTQLLESIYGSDILNYACHLSIINLAIRDLIDDDNFPRIHQGDFLQLTPGTLFSTQPVRIQAGGLVTETREIPIEEGQFDAIVGNPPYIQSREMSAEDREAYYESAQREWSDYAWRRVSDIYCYFWTHSTRFLSSNGYLALLTQAAWLDVDYGIPLQEWMIDHFKILAILETEAEPWFTGARVATAVTILQREEDAELRQQNTIRFVQFRKRLSSIVGRVDNEQERLRAFERLRDRLLSAVSDVSTEDYRLRVVSQSDIEHAGVAGGRYIGSKWGRYLRSTETLYRLQAEYSDGFVPLTQLALIQRGITTNCDSFFLVTNISQEALSAISNAGAFRERYGVSRTQVSSNQIALVRRRDGVELPIESRYLQPILRTARDYSWFTTGRVGSENYAVFIPEDRGNISRLAEEYIQAGEREEWHLAPSFQHIEESGGNWYTLRDASSLAPILFIKTMQYTPLVLLNDGGLLANQRLYNVWPHEGISELALCAILNSTVFACERYAAVKALGREAAIDVEVFSARAYRCPDLRQFPDHIIAQLSEAMTRLSQRPAGTFLEEPLIHAGHSEALAYSHRHPMSRETWPIELQDETRQEIDRLILLGLGVPEDEVPETLERLYNEISEHLRRMRLLELEAQINRRGGNSSSDPAPRQLADEIWAQLIEGHAIQPRIIPEDFLPAGEDYSLLFLPAGRFRVEAPSLFDEGATFACTVGRTRLEFDSAEQLNYIRLLTELGVSGDTRLPLDAAVCHGVREAISAYYEELQGHFTAAAAEITGEGELGRRIIREGLKRVIQR